MKDLVFTFIRQTILNKISQVNKKGSNIGNQNKTKKYIFSFKDFVAPDLLDGWDDWKTTEKV
jgi:hypothetical protein